MELLISGPGKNALGTELMDRLTERIREATAEPLLVRGDGGVFSAGLNLKEVAGADREGVARILGALDRLIDALYYHPAPTVACIEGHAIAGGCVVALCCDYRVATADARARIGLNEVAIGLAFPPKILKLARRRVAPRALERVLLEAGLYDPATALALGLVDEVAADALGVAHARLEALAAHPRATYAATKRALRQGGVDLSAEDQARQRDEVVPAWCAPAVKERVAGMLRRAR
jgi:enoyl-CoA hydratase/carnithine racemase